MKGGVILGKRYEILSKIGAGGMADVYKGHDQVLNRKVAIKILKKEYREDENFVRKFRSEAQAAAGLMNPNIVNVYDVGEDRGLYYMVMELVEGITLKEYIRRKGRLGHRELISIAIQMCTGIGAAHAAGIIHRDIKPQNIIISKEGKVKVTDFGIAKATTSNTVSSNAMGSVHYSSPEQARGGFSDAQSDIYSIGITLFEMATGELPFDGESTVAVAIKHLQEEIRRPSELVPDIPYSLEQIILKCTQKQSVRRYKDTDELILDLKKSLIDPDGDFVVIPPLNSADTVIISDTELDMIRDSVRDDDYDDDDDEDDDEEEFEEEDYAEARQKRNRRNRYEDEEEEDEEDEEDEEEEDEDVNPRMKKIMKILMIVVIVIMIFILIFVIGKAAGIFRSASSAVTSEESEKIEVPDVTGMTYEAAKEKLNSVNLGIKIKTREESDKYEEDKISSQDPAAGEEAEKNTTVQVVISTGLADEMVEIPDVVGMDESTAQKALETAGFVVGTSDFEYSDRVEEGEVISTNPETGTEAAKGSTVVMQVSKGSEKVEVPNVVGKSDENAQSILNNAGLSVTADYQYNDSVDKGKVVSQSIGAGERVSEGTSITIVISNGPKDTSVTVPDLSGQTIYGAESLLESAGLVFSDGGQESSDTVKAGKVTRWSPSGKVKKGSKVTVYYSSGPEEEEQAEEEEMEEEYDEIDGEPVD